MKDLQILLAALKYHLRRFIKLFKSQDLIMDERGNYYIDGNYHRILYWRAYQNWQMKRFERGQVNVGTDLFEKLTNIKK
jgi:hypothetical protein